MGGPSFARGDPIYERCWATLSSALLRGDDTIYGGSGTDLMWGGAGNDAVNPSGPSGPDNSPFAPLNCASVCVPRICEVTVCKLPPCDLPNWIYSDVSYVSVAYGGGTGIVKVAECVYRDTDASGNVTDTYIYTVTNESVDQNGCGLCAFEVPNPDHLPWNSMYTTVGMWGGTAYIQTDGTGRHL